MDSEMIASLIYKLIVNICSVLIVWWGYKLFTKGITKAAGNVSALWGDTKIVLENAAPGIFLILLGGLVMIISANKGIDLKSSHKSSARESEIKNSLIISDTTIQNLKHNQKINTDSLYNLGKYNFQYKRYLDAYKYFLIVKGASFSDTSIHIHDIDHQITITTRALTQNVVANSNGSGDEETKSVNINDEDINPAK